MVKRVAVDPVRLGSPDAPGSGKGNAVLRMAREAETQGVCRRSLHPAGILIHPQAHLDKGRAVGSIFNSHISSVTRISAETANLELTVLPYRRTPGEEMWAWYS